MDCIRLTLGNLESKQAHAPCSYTAFSLLYGGKFITHEIPSENKFKAICKEFVK